jgi:hypothetical protein
VAAGEAVEHGGDVGFWVQAIQLGGFGDGVDDGGAIAARVRSEEQKILPR